MTVVDNIIIQPLSNNETLVVVRSTSALKTVLTDTELNERMTQLELLNDNSDCTFDIEQVTWKPLILKRLVSLKLESNYVSIAELLLPAFTPVLTSLNCSDFELGHSCSYEPVETILLCQSLKHIHLHGNPDFLIQLFTSLPLESAEIEVSEEMTPDTWKQILAIEGVSQRLKSLKVIDFHFAQGIEQPTDFASFDHLTQLTIEGSRLEQNVILLYASQNILKHLDISLEQVNFDLTRIHLPRIEKLRITTVQIISQLWDLLAVCGTSLSDLIVEYTEDISEFPNVKLDFPNLRSVTIIEASLVVLAVVLGGSKSKSLQELKIECLATDELIEKLDWKDLLDQAYCLRSYKGPDTFFQVLPESTFQSIQHIELYITSSPIGCEELSEQVFQRIVKCRRLQSFMVPAIAGIASSQWFAQLLELPEITKIELPMIQNDEQDFTSINSVPTLSHLSMDAGLLEDINVGSLFDKFNGLTSLSLTNVPIDQFSTIMETLSTNNQSLKELKASLIYGIEQDKINEFVFWGKPLDATLEFLSVITLQEMLLLTTALFFESNTVSSQIYTNVSARQFLPEPYNEKRQSVFDYKNLMVTALHSLVPSVVKQLKGISDQRRLSVEESLLKTDPALHKVIAELVSTAYFIESHESVLRR